MTADAGMSPLKWRILTHRYALPSMMALAGNGVPVGYQVSDDTRRAVGRMLARPRAAPMVHAKDRAMLAHHERCLLGWLYIRNALCIVGMFAMAQASGLATATAYGGEPAKPNGTNKTNHPTQPHTPGGEE